MKRKTFILCFVLSIIHLLNTHAQQRIIGGSNANISEAPWQVLVQKSNGDFGGGSIISSNLILTARHVVVGTTASQIQVGAGISKRSDLGGNNSYGVSRIILHPTLDVALLVLSRNLSYSNNIKPIDILSASKSSFYDTGNSVFITGWGSITHNQQNPTHSNQLQKVNLSIVNNSAFAGAYSTDVVGYSQGKKTFLGDSGGPWAVWDSSAQRYVLIGIVRACAGDESMWYSMAVRTSLLMDFISPYYTPTITGGVDQVCTSQTYSLSEPCSTVTWSCTGPLRITSQSNTSCTVSSTGNGTAVLKATIKSGNYTKTVERKLISGGYTSCTISYGNSVNGNSDTWCTSHSGNYFSIESDYDLNSYEVRLKKYPGLQVVMTTTASKGQNTLNYMLSQGWYTMEARLLGCKNGDWVTTGEVEAVDCSSNYSFSLTPNPATNVVTLTLDDVNTPDPRVPATFTVAEGGKYEVQIWSETALMKKYTFDRPAVDIPVSDLRSGRYFVLVIVNGKKLTQQLIIR